MSATVESALPVERQGWHSDPGQQVILYNVSWETYERLLREHDGNSSTHFSYDQGKLEIIVLSAKHERKSRVLSHLVSILAEELEMDIVAFGSTTFQRPDLQKGFEPDGCFYVTNEAEMRNKLEIDLTVDPAPDLIIEIDITSPSLNKFPIFAALGIQEIWRYDGETVRIWCLAASSYQEAMQSSLFPLATGATLTEFLEIEPGMRRTEWLRRVRTWIRSQMG